MSEILSAAELARFNRHIILPQVGLGGQEKLKLAKVLCIGTGGILRWIDDVDGTLQKY